MEQTFVRNGKSVVVFWDENITKVTFELDELTGLPIVFEFNSLFIKENNKTIHTTYKSYNLTPTGEKINFKEINYTTPNEDYEYFFALIGELLKRSILNGLANKLEITKFFDESGNIIE